MRRRTLLIALGLAAFLAVSFLLARFLTLENRERALILEALERRAGAPVEILRLDSPTAYSLGRARGATRVAWRLPAQDRTVVQCADVERTGSVLSGRRIILHGLSAPIGLEASCPK